MILLKKTNICQAWNFSAVENPYILAVWLDLRVPPLFHCFSDQSLASLDIDVFIYIFICLLALFYFDIKSYKIVYIFNKCV